MATARAPVCTTCEIHAEAVFRVEGMDCNEEVVILERRLRPLAGMEALSADLVGQRLHVSYDAAKLTTAAIVDAVGQTGMRMWLEHEGPGASSPDVRVRFWLTVASGTQSSRRWRSGNGTRSRSGYSSLPPSPEGHSPLVERSLHFEPARSTSTS